MKLVFVARDVGNGLALLAVASLATTQGHDVITHFGNGQPFPNDATDKVRHAIIGADVLVVSLSSSPERVEMETFAMKVASDYGIRLVIVSDMFGMAHRSRWCRGLARDASLLTVIMESERESARRYVGDHTRIVVAPNPVWVTYFDGPTEPDIHGRLGIPRGDRIMYVGGSKEKPRNMGLLASLRACMDILPHDVRVVIGSHPGGDHSMESLGVIDSGDQRVVFLPYPKGNLSTHDIIDASSLVLTGGGSTITLMGTAKRVPTIDLMLEDDRRWWRELSGLNFWPPAEGAKISALATSADELSQLIPELLDPKSSRNDALETAQSLWFTRGQNEGAAKTILDAILKL